MKANEVNTTHSSIVDREYERMSGIKRMKKIYV